MKKIISIILAALFLLSAAACDNTNNNNKSDSTDANTTIQVTDMATTEEIATTEEETTTPPETTTASTTEAPVEVIEEVFKVGYSIKDITPKSFPIKLGDNKNISKVNDPIYTTCVAVNDGTTTVLIYTVDVANINADQYELIRKRVSSATKVPAKNILMAPTHNHSVPKLGVFGDVANNKSWTLNVVHTAMINAAKEAIADLDDAEIYTSVGKTTGMAFVRRYFLADGSFKSIQSSNTSKSPVVAYESEADDTVQVIRFVRENKKDVVMANWQAHAAHAVSEIGYLISGDLVGHARTMAESLDDDILFALYFGASGNINLTAAISGTQKYSSYVEVGKALGREIVNSFASLKKVESGKINISCTNYTAEVRKDSEKRVAQAEEAHSKVGTTEGNTLLKKYGFESKYDAEYTVFRNKSLGATQDLPLTAVSFGDLAFVTVPFEMFDTNGVEIKEGSPFEMTFVLTNTGNSMAYVPSALAVPNGGYEVYTTHYAFGTAEKVVGELLSMLKTQKKNKT